MLRQTMLRAFLLFVAVATAHADERIDRLLASVEEQYRSAQSFHFSTIYRNEYGREMRITWDSSGSARLRLTVSGTRLDTGYLDRWKTDPSNDREILKYQDAHDWKFRVVADGASVWTENWSERRYSMRPLTAFAREDSAGRMYDLLIGRYREISSKRASARIVGRESGCTVVEIENARYWIDDRWHLIVREVVRSGKSAWSLRSTAASVNARVPADTFRFQPSRRAVLVGQVTVPGMP
jgi:hypothetical protein